MAELIIKNLHKTYANGVKALDDVTLTIGNGMFGLLGPNGAGKSSLMRTLAALQEADTGSAHLDDIDIFKSPTELRKVLGYLPQEFGVYQKITAFQLLDHLAILKGIQSKKERKDLVGYLLNKTNLWDVRNKSVKEFSGGMKQRVGIAQALIGEPRLIIVDEPTAGLDPGERNRFHNLLSEVGNEVIVILSTHIVDDVKELCAQMAIMNFGKIMYHGEPATVIAELDGKVYQKAIEKNELEQYQQDHQVISMKMFAGKPLIHVLSDSNPGDGFKAVAPSLEDAFFAKVNPAKSTVNA